jgi:SAM-dependent methyltransferase
MLEIRHSQMNTTADTQQAYDEIYAGEGILQLDSFYLWLISLLDAQEGRMLLDISCGQGRLVTLAQRQGLRAMGADFSMQGVQIGLKETPAAWWVTGDGEKLPYADGSMDYVTHIGSLEHYQNPQAGAAEIARILKPGGKAVVLLPNSFGLLGNIKYVARHGDIFDDGQPLQRYGTRRVWETILTNSGLKIQKVVGYSEIPAPRTLPDWLWLLKRPQKIVRKFLNLFIPINLTNHFVFICSHD